MPLNLSKIIDYVKQEESSDSEKKTISSDKPSILIVDDEESITNLYSKRLRLTDDYEVLVANGGKEGVKKAKQADVILLDRRMPEMTGDEALEEIKKMDIDPQVVMVTAVEPDVDIIEMGFDHYVVKPVSEEELYQTVEYMLARNSLDEKQQRYHSLRQKQELLREELDPEKLEEHDEYNQLQEKIDELQEEVDDLEKVIEFYYAE